MAFTQDAPQRRRNAVSPIIRQWMMVAIVTGLSLTLQGCAGTELFAGGRSEAAYGDYLAARYAASVHEPAAAQQYFARTLAADPGNAIVLERAFLAALTGGDMDRALGLARALVRQRPDHRMARLVLSLADIRKGDYKGAQEEISSAEAGPFVALVGALAQAWAAAGDGDRELALSRLKAFEGKSAFDLFRAYHKALILDMLGDTAGAEEAYRESMDASGGTSIRIVEAYASFLQRRERPDEARAVLDQYETLSPEHPLVKDALSRLARTGKLAPLVSNASEGVAEALYGLGSALAQDASGNDLAVLYLQLAIYMRPGFDVAHTLLADSYEQRKRWADAIAAYAAVGKDSPLYRNARIQTALDLDKLDREDEAVKVLRAMLNEDPKALEPVIALGDIYRGKEKYAEAAAEYTRAITLAGEPVPARWSLYYARGICRERLGQWPLAEEDLKLALKLSDEHPLVLNYLGYSWIEQGRNLDKAMTMIEKAVELRPGDGFIVDSLGWAHYRLGDYRKAAEILERAVELEPGDPTINEHLGDALWKVGRRIEARFQWSHALEMKPGKDRIELLRAKLEFGLEIAESEAARREAGGAHGS